MRSTAKHKAYILSLKSIDKTMASVVGGKGANLGELSTLKDINVPDGFCISTEAFTVVTEASTNIALLLDQLATFGLDDKDRIGTLGIQIRQLIEEEPIHQEIVKQVQAALSLYDDMQAFAVRSSATAEDLPTASFAGQQDTYLNVMGAQSILEHISKCWASLFTERAIMYRIHNGFDHRKVALSVVVQKMIFADASGILFTADPITGNRKITSIDASFGLGEAIVSGLVSADNYKVKGDTITEKRIGIKKLGVYALDEGGTEQLDFTTDRQNAQTITDRQIVEIEHIGRRIEVHFGCPQDIEWCLSDGVFYILQSRPITTLFPIPKLKYARTTLGEDGGNRVYVSVGHQQMMTDAMKPLGLSFFQITPMMVAGGRLFKDVTKSIASPSDRAAVMNTLGKSDPLVRDALDTILDRDGFINLLPDPTDGKTTMSWLKPEPIDDDPEIVSDLIRLNQESLNALRENIQRRSGSDLMDFIASDLQNLKFSNFEPRSMAVIVAAMNAATWINENLKEWLGETNASDTLSQSVPHNITSAMGLALLDVADVIRKHPEVVEYLKRVETDSFMDELINYKGGIESRNAIKGYLDKFGMRCVGEIDITRTRWAERPLILVPIILGNVRNFAFGESRRKFEQGQTEAFDKEQQLLRRLLDLPDGESRMSEAKLMISRIRNFSGYREYPKYGIVSRFFIYKQALMNEANRLFEAGVIRNPDDIYYLSFEELCDVVKNNRVDQYCIDIRREEFKLDEKMTPPRVITSDGEVITGKFNRANLPAGALEGMAVSVGSIEGRARVILQMEDAILEEGDILVTTFTDPSWTPLFVALKGLVTEVGGLMTHGAVIAREYGIPAVVSVENATKIIKDGQCIRVNGTDGYVELL